MKANEAPEKLYLFENPITETPDDRWLSKRSGDTDVEYIRKDAFIEKADEFIGSFFHPDDTKLRNCLLKKFHEYMKGE